MLTKKKGRAKKMGLYDDINEDSKEITAEEYKKLWGAKEKKSMNPIKRLFGKKPAPSQEETSEEEYGEIAEDQIEAERDLTDRKLIEYSERQAPIPESEEELTAKLFEVDSKLSSKKEITRVMDKQLGLERDIALESADEYPEIFSPDGPKSNLDDMDMISCFLHGINVIEDRIDGKAYGFPLKSAAGFDAAVYNMKMHLSRGKDGFSVKQSRTHSSSSTLERIKRKRQIEAKQSKSFF